MAKKSSNQWCQRQEKDIYVKLAKKKNYRSRAAFKLLQLHEKYKIFQKNSVIVDLGAAPGSWSQVAQELVGESSKIIAIDQLSIKHIDGVITIKKNLLDEDVEETITKAIGKSSIKVDLILSDISPNISGINSVDMASAIYLWQVALNFALKTLKPNGKFLIKLFHCDGFIKYIKLVKNYFGKVVICKPLASRADSKEVYCFAQSLIKQKEVS